MGLFNFRKKNKVELCEAPLGYWEEESYMIAIPRQIDKDTFSNIKERVNAIEGVELKAITPPTEKDPIRFVVEYDKEQYSCGIYAGDFSLPDIFGRQDYYFTEKEWDELKTKDKAVTLFMKCNDDAKKSFHLQLKLIVALVPDLLGVMDESAERMLCARWVKMAAASSVTPGPNDMFIVQAVSDEKGKVWLHTHGLCRFGITELEIVDSDKDNYNNHYNVISCFANRLLDKKEKFEARKSSSFLGYLSNNQPIVTTYVSWTEGLNEYPKLKLGGAADREGAHNTKTSLIFLYTCEEDEKNGKLTKVSAYDAMWGDNPLFFLSNEETERMRRLARERFHFVKDSLEKGCQIIIKIGLQQDDAEEGELEHIWFELNEFDGDRFKATLTQEPYNVSGIHKGDVRWFTINDVTDWIIYTDKYSVTPDKAYILTEEN